MAVVIEEVRSRRDIRKGIGLLFKIHKGNDNWVPPLISSELNNLDPRRNPSFEVCQAQSWLAFKEGRTVGRITAMINRPFIEKWGEKHARFGWFDFLDDREVSGALLDTAEAWAKEKGMESMVGPMGFTDFDEEGLLVEGFEEPGTFAMLYNPPYYKDHLEARGYAKDADWVEYLVTIPEEIPPKVTRVMAMMLERNKLRLAPITRTRQYRPYIPAIFDLLQEAYADLYGYVPLTPGQVAYYTKAYFSFLDTRFTKVILDDEDRVAGVGIAMPSLTRAMQKARGRLYPFGFVPVLRALKKPEVLDLYLVAVRKDLQNRGVNSLLMTEINKNALAAGIRFAETQAELETNDAVRSFWKHYDARQHKRRRVYRKDF